MNNENDFRMKQDGTMLPREEFVEDIEYANPINSKEYREFVDRKCAEEYERAKVQDGELSEDDEERDLSREPYIGLTRSRRCKYDR